MPIEYHRGCGVNVAKVGQGNGRMMMIHCSLARHEALLRLASHFKQNHQITLFDHPGHGQSADWDGVTPFQGLCVGIAEGLIDRPAHVLGHSFGATVALRLAMERPDLVTRLTLIEPVFFAAAKGTPEYDQHRRDFAPFERAMQAGQRAEAAEAFLNLWGAIPWRAMTAKMRQDAIDRIHLVPAGGLDIENDVNGLLDPGRLEALTIPVTLIMGGKTQPVVGAIHRALMARLHNARNVVIDGAGHMVPLTHAGNVAAAMM